MEKLEIIGVPQSTFVRTARLTAHEKGVAYTLVPVPPHTEEIDKVHPFGRIPGLRHGKITLGESLAIATYIDRAFPGPRLVPEAPAAAAEAMMWASLTISLFDQWLTRQYLFGYIFPNGPGGAPGAPNRAQIEAALPMVDKSLRLLSTSIEDDHLVGGGLTLADLYVLPILGYVRDLPEAGDLIARLTPLRAYCDLHFARESLKATLPPRP